VRRRFASLGDRDLLAAGAGAVVFSFALGIATVALPLLALHAGYGKAAVGYFTALSAICQMGSRMVLGAVMRRYPDWLVVFAAGGLLTGSCALVAATQTVVPFAVAESLQGVARGCFWTGSQTHVVRTEGSSVRRLASVQFVSSFGLLGGPIAAGFIGDASLSLAMYTAAAVAAAGMVPPLLMTRLPPFPSLRSRGRDAVWRRPGVDVGCLAGVTAGSWRGLLTSYVPVALQHAGQSAPAIGGLVAVANGASVAGAALIGRLGNRGMVRSFATATVATGVGTALIGMVASIAPLGAAVLLVSGLGAGTLQSLGPGIATDAVHPDERGDAIAVAGTYRAGALFVSPLAVGASLAVVPMAAAIAVVGGLIALPALASGRVRRVRQAADIGADSVAWTA
jgi:MFS family permease